ncbi:NifB/NifX family molybdenum-iron cluster-binding protein [Gorillibacterium timonense]|uniref:NifB/NifX family molybdenum-iron cluster-binding protein n=1 Tax=Gorillibacterium timonense TaxID=1689269 RepID=UPI00071DEA31|nr:NifB/NifX family molybdenum-iron cluster-binding protein [Gorillibacterium timonense]
MIKIAFCTSDGKSVNMHFGLTHRFAVYGLDKEQLTRFPDTIVGSVHSLEDIPPLGHDRDKIAQRIHALSDCLLVYSTRIGSAAAARLTAQRLMPIQVADGTSILAELEKLQDVLKKTPPPWLEKALKQSQRKP